MNPSSPAQAPPEPVPSRHATHYASLPRRARSVLSQRVSGLPAWVVVTELFIGLGWIRAATEKVIDPSWWSGEALLSFLTGHEGSALGWYQPFLDLVVSRNLVMIAIVVVLAQLAAGLSLITGRFLAVGLAIGLFLNLSFIAAGAVSPSAFYVLSQGGLALWLAERVDRRRTLRSLSAASFGGITLAVLSLPFITTLHPAEVIEDPAIMLVTGGSLTVTACQLARRRLIDRIRTARPVPDDAWGQPSGSSGVLDRAVEVDGRQNSPAAELRQPV